MFVFVLSKLSKETFFQLDIERESQRMRKKESERGREEREIATNVSDCVGVCVYVCVVCVRA